MKKIVFIFTLVAFVTFAMTSSTTAVSSKVVNAYSMDDTIKGNCDKTKCDKKSHNCTNEKEKCNKKCDKSKAKCDKDVKNKCCKEGKSNCCKK